MCWLVVDAVKPGALPLDPAPAESPFPCGGWSRIPPLQGVAQASNGTCFPRLRLWLLWLLFGDGSERRCETPHSTPPHSTPESKPAKFGAF